MPFNRFCKSVLSCFGANAERMLADVCLHEEWLGQGAPAPTALNQPQYLAWRFMALKFCQPSAFLPNVRHCEP
jgi:hypothetical protein